MSSKQFMPSKFRRVRSHPEPEAQRHRGSAVAKLYGEAFQMREHLFRSFMREITAPYRDAKLTLFWAIMTPVVPITAYAFLKIALSAFPSSDGIDPAVYVALGVTFWFWMNDIVFSGVSGLNKNKTMLAQSRYPLIATIFSRQSNVVFDTFVRLAFSAILVAIFSTWSAIGILGAFALMVIMAVMAHGFGLILTVLWASTPDMKNLAEIGFRYAFFISNVLFPLPTGTWTVWLYRLNPFAIALNNARYFIVYGKPVSWVEIGAISALALIVFLIGSRLFFFAKEHIRETLV